MVSFRPPLEENPLFPPRPPITTSLTDPYNLSVHPNAKSLNGPDAHVHVFCTLYQRRALCPPFKQISFFWREIRELSYLLQLRCSKLIYFHYDPSYLSVNAFTRSSLVFFRPSTLFPVILFSIRSNILRISRFISSLFWLISL